MRKELNVVCFYFEDFPTPSRSTHLFGYIVLSFDASASRTKARPTALSGQLDFCAETANF